MYLRTLRSNNLFTTYHIHPLLPILAYPHLSKLVFLFLFFFKRVRYCFTKIILLFSVPHQRTRIKWLWIFWICLVKNLCVLSVGSIYREREWKHFLKKSFSLDCIEMKVKWNQIRSSLHFQDLLHKENLISCKIFALI